MEQAIKKAIEGGWKPKTIFISNGKYTYDDIEHKIIITKSEDGWNSTEYIYWKTIKDNFEKYLLDPLFWQALGKACEWTDEVPHTTDGYPWANTGWETYWHRFIDHIAEGKDADSFFNELIK